MMRFNGMEIGKKTLAKEYPNYACYDITELLMKGQKTAIMLTAKKFRECVWNYLELYETNKFVNNLNTYANDDIYNYGNNQRIGRYMVKCAGIEADALMRMHIIRTAMTLVPLYLIGDTYATEVHDKMWKYKPDLDIVGFPFDESVVKYNIYSKELKLSLYRNRETVNVNFYRNDTVVFDDTDRGYNGWITCKPNVHGETRYCIEFWNSTYKGDNMDKDYRVYTCCYADNKKYDDCCGTADERKFCEALQSTVAMEKLYGKSNSEDNSSLYKFTLQKVVKRHDKIKYLFDERND